MADETKAITPIMGPYRGNLLVVSAADADAAINAHWARDASVPYGSEAHDQLTEQERADAFAAAHDWAALQWEHNGNPPPPETPLSSRAMGADEPGRYQTRGAEAPGEPVPHPAPRGRR